MTLPFRTGFALGVSLFAIVAGRLVAANYTVDSVADLQARIAAAEAGDTITVKDGAYTTAAALKVERAGTKEKPITITAQTIGGVEIRGTHGFEVVKPAAYV